MTLNRGATERGIARMKPGNPGQVARVRVGRWPAQRPAHEDFAARKLDILRAQAHRVHDAQSHALQQGADQPVHAVEASQHLRDLLA